ncbi:2-phospho-L-lactate transferase CofD family protein [Actinomadura sp. NBRC 104425]|uniref:gluconeogenesis factor YvcK family protein n=1 Tax=Actinomadura sp. NBRC 104425 TaxID=3032204 RepID=UPI00255728AE|nr:2-phospho-L-lactate transferase CofD family protein [Actinomadura sp. NBRC 104425]
MNPPGPRVVALGGGHGLYASLSALRRVTRRLCAVVTVADDGGSSGRLRRELGVLPPGDLRMALAALCGDDDWGRTWRDVVQHRFRSEGALHEHAVGNLLIVALWELLGAQALANGGANGGARSGADGGARSGADGASADEALTRAAVPAAGGAVVARTFEPAPAPGPGAGAGAPVEDPTVAGLDWVGRLLGAHGRVLPMASVPLDIVAQVRGADPDAPDAITEVKGQVACAKTPGKVLSVSLVPPDPPACPDAVRAVEEADWVVFGPGSWFTSVLPHLKVPELARALTETKARRVVALNLAPQPGETDDFSPQTHLEVLQDHAPDLRVDVVVADRGVVDDPAALDKAVQDLGGRLLLADVAADDGSPRHDPARLAQAFVKIFRE